MVTRVLGCLALAALAKAHIDETTSEAYDAMLGYLDKDKDGMLSLDEVLSQEELDGESKAAMEKDFKIADKNGDGKLDVKEHALQTAKKRAEAEHKEHKLHLAKGHGKQVKTASEDKDFKRDETTSEAYDQMVSFLDKDEDGMISLDEILSQESLDKKSKAKMEKDFKIADRNGDGELDIKEHAILTAQGRAHQADDRELFQPEARSESEETSLEAFDDLASRAYGNMLTYLDNDKDGLISMREVLSQEDLDEQQRESMVKEFMKADRNGDGKLDVQEHALHTEQEQAEADNTPSETFHTDETTSEAYDAMLTYLDKDKDGMLSLDEVLNQEGLDEKSKAAMEMDFRIADENGDGLLDVKEHALHTAQSRQEAKYDGSDDILV
eukprot:TRINITY_DN79365_c0_g1_i1.p1 TRINITY_DN79365_c0_g1~~TRINITY_DN79365_c0_g1_i1.p1  ORF type:complete len:383 (-),score=130.67 TRINITY_DN79365_c0_g1_i1:46-1194(-)